MTVRQFLYKHTVLAIKTGVQAAARDYGIVFRELGEDIRARPLKAASRVAAAAAFGVACLRAPAHEDYIDALCKAETELIECGSAVNRASVEHVEGVLAVRGIRRLHYLNLGPVSLMVRARESDGVHSYMGSYWTLHHWLTEAPGRVIDYGAWGHWFRLEKAMENYDEDDTL